MLPRARLVLEPPGGVASQDVGEQTVAPEIQLLEQRALAKVT